MTAVPAPNLDAEERLVGGLLAAASHGRPKAERYAEAMIAAPQHRRQR